MALYSMHARMLLITTSYLMLMRPQRPAKRDDGGVKCFARNFSVAFLVPLAKRNDGIPYAQFDVMKLEALTKHNACNNGSQGRQNWRKRCREAGTAVLA